MIQQELGLKPGPLAGPTQSRGESSRQAFSASTGATEIKIWPVQLRPDQTQGVSSCYCAARKYVASPDGAGGQQREHSYHAASSRFRTSMPRPNPLAAGSRAAAACRRGARCCNDSVTYDLLRRFLARQRPWQPPSPPSWSARCQKRRATARGEQLRNRLARQGRVCTASLLWTLVQTTFPCENAKGRRPPSSKHTPTANLPIPPRLDRDHP